VEHKVGILKVATARGRCHDHELTHNVVDKSKGCRGVQAIWLSSVWTAPLFSEPDRLPSVEDVSKAKGNAHSRHELAPNDLINVVSGNSKIRHGLNCIECSEESGEIIKEELCQTAPISTRHAKTLPEIV